MRKEIRKLYNFNKNDILEDLKLNKNLTPYMQHLIDIVERLDLPNLEKIFDYEKHPDEALVYEVDVNQECTFPTVAISINRIYDIKLCGSLRDSHTIMYSIPIIIVPLYSGYQVTKEDIEDLDQDSLDFNYVYNYFLERKDNKIKS